MTSGTPESGRPTSQAGASAAVLSSKEQYQEKQKRDRQIKATRADIKKIEDEIGRLETAVAEWDVKMSDPATHGVDLSDVAVFESYNELKTSLNKAMKRWEELHFELEILES